MTKKYLLFIILLLIVIVVISIMLIKKGDNLNTNRACVNNNCFDVEIAKTFAERSKGLMNRESLDENSGMFFIFDEEEEYSFWMKNTLIPLDIIWLNKDMEIVHIEKNVQPCKEDPCQRYTPTKPAQYVLELNAGQTDKNNIEVGNKLIFK